MIRPYRSKSSSSVLAVQVTQPWIERLAEWCGGVVVVTEDALDSTQTRKELNVPTPEGNKRAMDGHYIIQDQQGNFSVKTAAEFESSHEPAEDPLKSQMERGEI